MKLEVLNDRVLNLLVNLSQEKKVDKAEVKRLIKELQINPLISAQTKRKNSYEEFDNTHDGIAIYVAVDNGKDFRIVYFNSAAEKIEAIKKEKIIGKNVTEVFPGVKKLGLLDVFTKVWETGIPANHPISIYEDDRILGWRENSIYKLATGEIVASYRDVTKQKKAEAEVINSESKLKSLIDNKEESIWSIDTDYNYIIFNNFYKEQYFLAYKIKLEKGINSLDLLTDELISFWKEKYDRALTGERFSFEFSIKVKKDIFFYEVWLNPIISSGKITGVSALSIDITERILRSRALYESEEKYKQIIESSLDIIFLISPKGKLLFFNDSLERILGYKQKEVIGKSFKKFTPLKEIPKYLKELAKIFRKKDVKNFITQIYHKNGKLIDIEITGRLIKHNGKYVGQGTIRDISERIKIEKALKEKEENYRGIFNSTSDAIYIQNKDGIFVDVNVGAEKMYGYKRDSFIGNTPEFISAPGKNDLNMVMASVNNAYNGEEQSFEYWGIRKNGEIFPKNVTLNPGTYNGEKVVIAVAKDIGEYKKYEEKIKNLLHFAPDAFFHGDEVGNFIMCNEAACLLTGYNSKELRSMNIKDLFSKTTLDEKPLIFDMLSNGKTLKRDRKLIKKNGDVITVEMSSNKMKDGTYQSFIRDITDRKIAEEALRESETKYKLIAEKASDVVWLMDLKGKSMFVTPSIEKFTGYSVLEYLSQTIDERFTSDSANLAKSVLFDELTKYKTRKISKDYSKRIELDYRCKDGLTKMGELLITPFFGEKGFLLGIHGVTRDITERKKIENALKESERNFRLLFEKSPLGTYIATPEGQIVDGNTALLEMLGSPSLEATKKINVLSFLPLVSNGYADKFKECVETNRILFLNIKYKSKWGRERTYSSYVIPMSNNKGIVERVYTIMEDITDKNEAELALKNNEEKYRLISSITSDYIYESGKNSNGVFDTKWVAGSFKKITGFSLEEFIKSGGWKAHLHPLDEEKDNSALRRLQKNKAITLEVRMINKDGKIVWIRNVCSPIWDKKNNKLSGIIGACSDITAMKRNEFIQLIQYNIAKAIVNVKNTEELFKFVRNELLQFVDVSNFFVALYNKETKRLTSAVDYDQDKTHTWDAEKSITGFVIKSKKRLFIHKKELLKLIKSKKIKTVGKIPEVWLGYPLLSGSNVLGVIVVQSYNNPNAYDDLSVELMGVVASQLSLFIERNKAEEDSVRLSKAIAQSPVSVIVANSDGTIEYVNPQFEKITGYTFEEAYGKDTRILNSGQHPNEFFKILWETISSGDDWSGEIYNRKKNGELFWENVIISPILNDKKKITHFVAIKEDITEKKKMVEELIASKEKAEISEKIKTEFLAQMSHEIRSPLNTIMSFIELIKEEVSDSLPDDFSYSFQSIESASTRIIRTIDLILNTTDLQLGTYKISVGEINVVNMLKQIKDEYTQSANNKGLDIQLDLEFNRKKIISDEYALIQIISNLVDNAIKYTDKGFVKISASKGLKNGLIIKIQDSGIGMSKKFLPNLFNSFTQEEQGYTRKFDGNGLGLALVKNYCNLISTEISVESKKGKETIFTLEVANLKVKQA